MAEQAGLSLSWSETPKTGFVVTRPICKKYIALSAYPLEYTTRHPLLFLLVILGWNSAYRNDPKFSGRFAWANSVDPDQTAPRGAV